MIEKTLGHYRVLSKLGAGGMGEVYRATDTRLGRDVALKVLPADVGRDSDRLARFQREAKALAALDHPNIVTIYSVEEAEGVHFLTMQLVEGQPLDRVIPEGGLPVERIVEIATAMAEALAGAHEKGIVHRDLKPANVMVTADGRVKVLDFGLAKELRSAEPIDATFTSAGQTQAGVVMGTPAYMSPEQVAGRGVDHRSDLFSLGVLLYEMASGCRPFEGPSSAELASAILRDAPTPVSDLRGDVPPDLARVIRRLLEKDPRDRIQSAHAVGIELRDAGTHPTPVPGAVAPARPADGPGSGGTRRDEGFWIAVLPFKARGGHPDLAALGEGLSEEIVTGLARFSYLRVVARDSTERFAGDPGDARDAGRALGARYVMEGSLRQAGMRLRVSAQLVDAVSGAHLWAETWERAFDPDSTFDLQDDLVPRIVSTVADMNGVLPRTMSEWLRTRDPGRLTPYEALLKGFGYYERIDEADHLEARTALERAVEEAPGHADCWALLSMLCAEEHKHGFNVRPDSLGRALQAARRAVAAAPSNAIAYHMLAQAHYFRRELQAFRAAAERAIALNPMDGCTTAAMGILIAYTGDWDHGCALAARAMELNPHHPGWYRFAAYQRAYQQRDYVAARDVALAFSMPSYFHTHAALAAAYGQLGDQAAAAESLRELLLQRPDFAEAAREEFDKWLGPCAGTEHVLEGLRKAGLPVPAAGSPVAPKAAVSTPASGSGSSRTDEGFWVAVLPLKYTGADPDLIALAEGLSEEIVTGLSRFSYLRVIARSSTARHGGETTDVRAVGKALGARYVMEGSLRQAGSTLRLAVQLVDAVSGAHLWAETYDRPFRPDEIFALQDDLVPRIVSTVADTNGVLPHTISEALRGRAPADLSPYEAVLRSFGYFARVTAEELVAARAGLESAVRNAPDYADAWAMLAWLCVQEYGQGFDRQPDSLASGLAAARRAVEAGPSNHLAYFGLAQALFFEKELESFRNAAERAVALNPMDGNSIAFMGELLIYAGDRERGLALAQRAKQLNPHHPGWYWYADFHDAYRQGEYRRALSLVLKVNLPSHWPSHAMLAAAYGQLGEEEAAAKARRDLLRLRPDFVATVRDRLAKWFAPEYVAHLTDGLRKAGLDVPAASAPAAPSSPGPAGSGASSQVPSAATTRAPAVAIAVLPFSDMSPARDQEYLCEGMAEEIINALTRMPGLRVIARTSAFRFRGEQDLRKVGEALGVGTVLEGSVRSSGSRLRITAQLIDVADDSHIWSERFDRELVDVFAIQDEIAAAIVEKLHLTLGTTRPGKRSTVNVAAYEALLEGRHHFSRFTPDAAERALACLRRALSLDPDCTDALVLHALYHVMVAYMFGDPREALAHARAFAGRALELDPDHAEAQAAMAVVAVLLDRDWSGGERLFRRALALAPASARVHELRGLVGLLGTGRLDEALAALDRAVELDPLSALYAGNRGRVLTCSRRFVEAEESCRRGLAIDPEQLLVKVELMYALTFQRRFAEAIAIGRRAIEVHGPTNAPLHALALSYALAGDHDEARRLLDGAAEPGSGRYQSPLTRALVHAACAEMDAAYECALRAIDERDPLLMYLEVHPMFDGLRPDARYPDLVRRMNLDERGRP